MIKNGKQTKVWFNSLQTWNVWIDWLVTVEDRSIVVSACWIIVDWFIVVSAGSTLMTVVGEFWRVVDPGWFSLTWDS